MSNSPLLALPPELRTQILEFILIQPDTTSSFLVPAHLFPGAPPRNLQTYRFCANILRTCRQLNAEGTPILYGQNTFHAHASLLATLPSLILLTKPNRVLLPPVTTMRVTKMIRRFHVHVRLDTDPQFTSALAEESFSGVEELEIEVFQASYGTSDFKVLGLFEGVRGVGKAVVGGSVGDGRYAGWLAGCMMKPPDSEVKPYSEEYVGGNRAWDAWTQGNR